MQIAALAFAMIGASIVNAAVLERGVVPGGEFQRNRLEHWGVEQAEAVPAASTSATLEPFTIDHDAPTPKWDLGNLERLVARTIDCTTFDDAVTTSTHDHDAMMASVSASANTLVDAVGGAANTTASVSIVTAWVTTSLPCTSSKSSAPASSTVTVDLVATQDPFTSTMTLTSTCDCSSSAAGVPMVTVQSSSSAAVIGVPAVASGPRTSTVTNTTTNFRTQTVTLKTSTTSNSTTAHPVATGVPMVVSASHSVSNGTSSTIGHPGFGTGTGRPSGTAPTGSALPSSSLLPLYTGAAAGVAGGANLAIVMFGLACMVFGGYFD